MSIDNKQQKPIILTIFGITGDLIKTYVLASLYELFLDNKFPKGSKIITLVRRDWGNTELRKYLREIMEEKKLPSVHKYTEFLELFTVLNGNFDDQEAFKKLSHEIVNIEKELGDVTDKVYYLAISPEHFKEVINNIGNSNKEVFGEKSFEEIKVIIEKPFGLDLPDAIILDDLISKYFKDEQIFRVDHYLAKYALRYLEEINFEKEFGKEFSIENAKEIHIRMLENLKVHGRISFYEKIGALRDTGQNHLLEVFATLIGTQSPKKDMDLVENRLAGVESLKILSKTEVKENVIRKQADEYAKIEGVKKDSNTETYFNIKTTSNYFKEKELKVILEGGKYQKETIFSIEITYPKHTLVVKFKPTKSISLWTSGKSCDLVKEIEIPSSGKHSEYYNIFLEASNGNSKYFVSKDEVVAEWKFVHPILEYWKSIPIAKNQDRNALVWRILVLGYILILILCVVVIVQMTR